MTLRATNFGAIIVSLTAPDRAGTFADVVFGHDAPADYLASACYFGAIVGRYGNRIALGSFTLDGRSYQLATNNGPNHLHGGIKGFDKVVWTAEPKMENGAPMLVLRYTSPHGEEGYPGTLQVEATYTLTNDNTLELHYTATTDRATPVNLTQHSYFNLSTPSATFITQDTAPRSILDHVLRINADHYVPTDSTSIPTALGASVDGTPFDFRTPTAIGARIDVENEQVQFGRGYDHHFVLSSSLPTGPLGLPHAAHVTEPVSGRTLDVYTSEPGLQFYSGNFLQYPTVGKNGERYGHRGAFCLETQHMPDSPNQSGAPSVIVRPGDRYDTRTVYAFGTTA